MNADAYGIPPSNRLKYAHFLTLNIYMVLG